MAIRNPFGERPNIEKSPRNSIDLSFNNNATFQVGKLYPVMCKEVNPGETWHIDTDFGLRFRPLIFPIQNRIRADIHFFYVRKHILWKNWRESCSQSGMKMNKFVRPYIHQPAGSDFWSIGSLSDYLGVPVSFAGNYGLQQSFPLITNSNRNDLFIGGITSVYPSTSRSLVNDSIQYLNFSIGYLTASFNVDKFTPPLDAELRDLFNKSLLSPVGSASANTNHYFPSTFNEKGFDKVVTDTTVLTLPQVYGLSSLTKVKARIFVFSGSSSSYTNWLFSKSATLKYFMSSDTFEFDVSASDDGGSELNSPEFQLLTSVEYGDNFVEMWNSLINKGQKVYVVVALTDSAVTGSQSVLANLSFAGSMLLSQSTDSQSISLSQIPEKNPFGYIIGSSSRDEVVPLSALPYRAYNACYNSFYREERVYPLLDEDGEPVYNKYVENDEDGADSFEYKLLNRPYEKDFLTSALPSPQMGIAPLVGLSSNSGKTSGSDPNTAQARSKIFTIQVLDEQTGEYKHFNLKSGNGGTTADSLLYLQYSNGEEFPVGALQNFADTMSQNGLSINDLRSVNSLQHWLENNMKTGYKYKDYVYSHTGVVLEAKECDMPEFLGGLSKDVSVSTIYQTTPNERGVLGDYAGTAMAVGSSKHSIHHYCDDHGYIIAIMSIVPVPVYSQLLPKMFLHTHNVLDEYSREFNHLGMQPITYREVCPVQTYANGDSVDDVFGYQKAWYEYFSVVDEVHGLFRSSLSNYLMDRVFDKRPELSREFLEVSSDDLNDVFAVSGGDEDKILGQIAFHITAERPIPLFNNPKLE